MVRVVEQKGTQIYSEKQKKMLSLLIRSIDQHPQSYAELLRRFNMLSEAKVNREQLIEKVLLMLSKGNARFNDALSELLGVHLQNEISYDGGEDNFALPIDSIAQAIGGISNAVSNIGTAKTQRFIAKEEAKKNAYEKILELRSQSEKSKQEQSKLEQGKLDQKAKKTKQMWIAVGVAASVLTLITIIYVASSKPAAQKI